MTGVGLIFQKAILVFFPINGWDDSEVYNASCGRAEFLCISMENLGHEIGHFLLILFFGVL